jgi:hypothetical protein
MNYYFELYEGFKDRTYKEAKDYYHYNESKWLYLYDKDDPEHTPWSRYALYVWPDSGLPNANALPYGKAQWGASDDAVRRQLNYWTKFVGMFMFLDWGVGESGLRPSASVANSEKGAPGNCEEDEASGTFELKNELGQTIRVMGQLAFGRVRGSQKGDAYGTLMSARLPAAINEHKWALGPLGSRAELEMVLRKHILQSDEEMLESRQTNSLAAQTMLCGRPLKDLTANDMRFNDAWLIAHHVTVNSYEYLLDPHWEQDRFIFDGHSMTDWYLKACNNENLTRRAAELGGAPYTAGGFCDVENASGVKARQRICDILANIKDFHGLRSVPLPKDDAQPGMPVSAFLSDYSTTKDFAGSYTFSGPYQARRAKAMFLGKLLNATYPATGQAGGDDSRGVNAHQYFAVEIPADGKDPVTSPRFNLTPEEALFGGDFVLEVAGGVRISEVGCGIFTVPIGPKIMDFDFHDKERKRLLCSRVDMFDNASNYVMVPTESGFDYRYDFETKTMNFIELAVSGDGASAYLDRKLSADSFLRVYGNVRNWAGKCVDAEGNECTPEVGGKGYVDLFAKVAVKKVSDGVDVNKDGDFIDLDLGDKSPVYEIDRNNKTDGHDPDHYLEGVVIRYYGTNADGSRDRANPDGQFKHDSNKDKRFTWDRDWRAENDYSGRVFDTDGRYMKPVLEAVPGNTLGKSGKGDDPNDNTQYKPEVKEIDGKLYDIRDGESNARLINPNGVVGDNIPDADWGKPQTAADKPGSLERDYIIDGVGAGGEPNPYTDLFWRAVDGSGGCYENLLEWLHAGKYWRDESIETQMVDDIKSGRSLGQIAFAAEAGGLDTYRFGSFTPYPVRSGDYNDRRGELYAAVKVNDPHYGMEFAGAPEQSPRSYILVLFPHARTPWTRRGNALNLKKIAGNDEKKLRAVTGIGHFDNLDKYPEVTVNAPRWSNYADGDMIVFGENRLDGVKKYRTDGGAFDTIKPRVINFVKLNGKNPDAGDSRSGPANAFERKNASISGGTYIVNAGRNDAAPGDASGTNLDCEESLPGGKTQKFPSAGGDLLTLTDTYALGRGFSARDLHDNRDPWRWDATGWDWKNDAMPPLDKTKPLTYIQQTPALTNFTSKKRTTWSRPPDEDWIKNVAFADTFIDFYNQAKGRLDLSVHGRGANSVFTQLDQADLKTEDPSVNDAFTWDGNTYDVPRMRLLPEYQDLDYDNQLDVTVASAAGIGKGRFPYPISTHTGARVGKSLAARILTHTLDYFRNPYPGTVSEGATLRFADRQWLRQLALGSSDMRMRSFNDLMWTTRIDEYFDSDSLNPRLGLLAFPTSPLRDMLSNDMTGTKEQFTTKTLWQQGNPLKATEGRYWSDRKTSKRMNLNEVNSMYPLLAMFNVWAKYGQAATESNLITNAAESIAPVSLLGNKPLRGYTYVNGWRPRAAKVTVYRDAAFWSDNLWADGSKDQRTYHGPEGVYFNHDADHDNAWAAAATVAPSPVYTAFILAQRLDASGTPLCEENVRVTVERTWDGKMNVLEYRVVPMD